MSLDEIVTSPAVIMPRHLVYTAEDLKNAYKLGERMGAQIARNPAEFAHTTEEGRASTFVATYRTNTKL